MFLSIKLLLWALVLFNGLLNASSAGFASSLDSYGKFHIDSNRVAMSGVSSGGTMAQMLQISYSKLFIGIAVFSHSFYRCGPPDGNALNYDLNCTRDAPPGFVYDPKRSLADISNYKAQGLIEDPAYLKNKRLYVYAGLQSYFRVGMISNQTKLGDITFYEPLIGNAKAIKTHVQDSGLVMPTNRPGAKCQKGGPGHNADCGFSGAYEAVEFLINGDEPGSSLPIIEPQRDQNIPLAPLQEFNQTQFTYDLPGGGLMGKVGYVYFPTSGCKSRPCLLHFFFHGCSASKDKLEQQGLPGSTAVANSGFLELAELNNMIVVFPQHSLGSGCWDTYGIGGPLYATRNGSQIIAMKRMLDYFLNA